MFSTLAGGRRYPGSISHRHKHVTFGKIAIGVAKGTAMIVIGVPVCTIAAGIGATAIVAYGLASPFYYGGKKIVKKIRRRVRKKEELEFTDRLTREDILVWLENCEGESDSKLQKSDSLAAESLLVDGGSNSKSTGTSADLEAGFSQAPTRKKPALRRLFSRENRSGFVLLASSPTAENADQPSSCVDVDGAVAGARAAGSGYQLLVNEPNDSEQEVPEQDELWREMEQVVHRLRQDRLSICPENIVTVDQPLVLENSQDVMQLIERLQLEGHLHQLARSASMPALSQCDHEQLRANHEDEDLISSLPQDALSIQKKRYLRAVSENGVLQQCGKEFKSAEAAAAAATAF